MNKPLVLITGASSGIGESLCHLLADHGMDLLITGRNQEALSILQAALQEKVRVKAVAADLSHQEGRRVLIDQIHALTPDLVVNCAGFGLYGDALTYETASQMEILEVDGMAVLEISLEAARTMASNNIKGTIVNVSSAAAFQVFPGCAVYAAAKAFVNVFSESFDQEMRPYGVRILAICPGMVDTSFQRRAGSQERSFRDRLGSMSSQFVAEQILRQIQQQKPLQIINWKYRFLTWLTRYLLPKRWTARALHTTILGRIPPRTIIKNDHHE